MDEIYDGMNPEVCSKIRDKVSLLHNLYELTYDADKIDKKNELGTKLLSIYQYFSDEARIPTYLKLLSNTEGSGKKIGTHAQPAFQTDYVKYVRAIHLKYIESKR